MKSQRGFTLIEILIALGILSVLTVATVQSIRRALRNKVRIETLSDHQNTLRDAMDVMRTDIERAYHYRDIFHELDQKVQKELQEAQQQNASNSQNGDGNTTDDPPPAIQQPPASTGDDENYVDPQTHFFGERDELHFVTLNLPRIRVRQKTANYAEVGYTLESCQSRSQERRDTQCLVRRLSAYPDDDIESGGRKIPLLEHVQSLEFRYIGEGKLDWVSQWKSQQGQGDADTTNKFPNLVEVTIEVAFPVPKSDNTRNYTRTEIIPILNPNNKTDQSDGGAAAGGLPGR